MTSKSIRATKILRGQKHILVPLSKIFRGQLPPLPPGSYTMSMILLSNIESHKIYGELRCLSLRGVSLGKEKDDRTSRTTFHTNHHASEKNLKGEI